MTERMAELDTDFDRPKEECGVVGVYDPGQNAANSAFFGLFALQHRGQESAGIAASDYSQVRMHKGMGLVNAVFDRKENLDVLVGEMAIGHTRYSTTGSSLLRNAQPVYCQSMIGDIAVAHNGNLINTRELRAELEAEGEHFDSTSDSEVLARILVRNMHNGIEEAVRAVMIRAKGAYSVTVLTPNVLVGFRDPFGVRPLTVGTLGEKGFYMASETCAFSPVGATPTHELEPGEMAIVDRSGMRIVRGVESPRKAMCLFEFIYFARPDSEMYGQLLYGVRERMGENLAREHPALDADIVVPVPDSGIPAALGFSRVSGIPYREGMTKSRYIHRTFIQPDQRMREMGVRMKLTPLKEHLEGKRVVLVDDSIVRGTTTRQLVNLLFESGAKEVHVRITAPPIQHPCYYGIDMANKDELIASRMSVDELAKHVGATSLGFLSIEGAVKAVGKPENTFCLACFSGQYPIPIPSDITKNVFEQLPVIGEFSAVRRDQLPFADEVVAQK